MTSPLADELRRINAQGDGGDHLGEVIAKGTARSNSDPDLMAPQTRTVDATPYPAAHGHRSRNVDEGSPGGQVPTSTGAVELSPVRKPV